jgi:eukaryotic-like serine/threonine-protein kinase
VAGPYTATQTMTSPDQPRTVLRHYEILGEIGRGGMGVVYEGRDRRDGSRVAIKALHPYLAAMDQGLRERFEREAHIAALLRSPYTVHLLDFGVEAGQYLLVMEFIEGESLAAILERGPIEPVVALQFAAEVARALEEAAARDVVHRDIKPDNILVESDGRVKVTDFGIARQSGGGGMTQVGAFVGTAAYAAPEQVEGDADSRSDIYSLGATLYCMLAGEPPFRGRTAMDVLVQHRTVSLPMAPLAGLPDIVQNIVRRCLEKDPRDRYGSPSELAAALERARAALMRSQTQPPPPSPTPTGYVQAQPARAGSPPAQAPPREGTVVAGPPTAPDATEIVSGPPATVIARSPSPVPTVVASPSQAPTSTVVAPAVGPAATVFAPPSSPPEARPAVPRETEPGPLPTQPGKRRRPNLALAGVGMALTAAAVFGIVLVLTNSGGSTPQASTSPTAPLGVVVATGTAAPTATPTPIPPTVVPPLSARFSILAAGIQARVVDSTAGADGLCPTAIWSQPSETLSASNKIVQRLCTNDVVTVGADPSTVAEGATWWHVTAKSGAVTGWAKEGTVDGARRFLALNSLTFKTPDNVIDAKSAYTAIIMTSLGSMTLELYADQSPRTVNNFVFLAEKGFYDGTTFFHLVKALFIEGGDPTGTGNGDAGYQLAVEGNNVRNLRGAISMSAVVGQFGGQFGSKFFIYTADDPSLDFDGTQLAKVFPFGKVTKGLDVLDQIAATKTQGANIAVLPVTISNVVIEQRPK